jgi:hypothetical protein
MTGEQKKWLDDHRVQGYRPMGTLGGASRWINRGMLHPDGTFEFLGARGRPNKVEQGSFEVAVLEHVPAPGMRGPA